MFQSGILKPTSPSSSAHDKTRDEKPNSTSFGFSLTWFRSFPVGMLVVATAVRFVVLQLYLCVFVVLFKLLMWLFTPWYADVESSFVFLAVSVVCFCVCCLELLFGGWRRLVGSRFRRHVVAQLFSIFVLVSLVSVSLSSSSYRARRWRGRVWV